MQDISIKVYGAFYPIQGRCSDLDTITGYYPMDEEWLLYEKDMLALSFEGQIFPVEEVIAALGAWLPQTASGKVDVIDLEAWTLFRYTWEPSGKFSQVNRDLNHILAYSGH